MSDGGDLRFTDNDGETLLPFWVEEVSGTSPNRTAKVWVKVADDLGSNVDIYCYYGNINAPNASNGEGVFDLFDDFDGTSLDTSKWETKNQVFENNGAFAYQVSVGYNTPSVSNGNLVFDGTRSSTDAASEDGVISGWWGRSVVSKSGISESNFIVEAKMWFTQSSSGNDANQFTCFNLGVGADKDNYIYGEQVYNNTLNLVREVSNTRADSSTVSHSFSDSTWKNIKFTFVNNGNCVYKIDTASQTYSVGQSLSTRKITLAFDHRAPSATVNQKVDYIFVRKYASTEPSYNTAGSEESGNYLTLENPLKFEKVRFDAANKKAEYFVKIPSVSKDNDTYFYLIYGRSGALDGSDKTEVWTDEFKSVWHLEENPAGTAPQMKDSTINGNNGTSQGSMTSDDSIEAKVAKGLDLDGSNDEITTTNQFTNPQTFSIGVLFKTSSASGKKIIGFEDSQTGTGSTSWDRHLYVGTDGKLYFGIFDGKVKTISTTGTVNDGNWHLAIGTFGSNTLKLYLDGALIGSLSTGAAQNYNSWCRIGGYKLGGWTNGSDGYFLGTVDEAGILSSVLSAAWIKADYNSLFDTLIKEELFILADTGSYTLTGITTGLKAFRKLLVGAGSYALTGINTAIKRSYSLISQAGSYALTGIATGLKAFRKLLVGAGSYTLTGIDAVLYKAYQFILSAGSYAMTGINTGLKAFRKLISSAGSYALTGIEAIFYKAYVLIASVGNYILTGAKAKLTAWIKEILHSATWTKEDTHNTIWHKE